MEPLLKEPEVCALAAISRATLRRAWADGLFPKPIRIGRRGIRWRQQDIEAFLKEQPDIASHTKD